MRVCVTGGRDYRNRVLIYSDLDAKLAVHGASLVIVCGYDPARKKYQGADQIAWEWAQERGVVAIPFPANWQALGRAAGILRNERMTREGQIDEALGYPTPGEENPGTNDMLKRLRRAGIVPTVRT